MKFIILLSALMAVALAVNEVPIVRSAVDITPEGSFSFGYETGDGTVHDAAGNADGVQGKFGYTSPEGQRIELSYTGDVNGFNAQGAHLPVGPEVPAHVLRALEYIRTHPPKEERKY